MPVHDADALVAVAEQPLPVTPLSDTELAVRLLGLLFDQAQPRAGSEQGTQSWVHRRVENVELLDGSAIRRRISIDLSVSDQRLSLIPVTWLRRGNRLRSFDLRDEDGRPLAVVTRGESDRLAKLGLTTYARAIVDAAATRQGRVRPPPLNRCVSDDLELIADGRDIAESKKALERFESCDGADLAIADDESFQRAVIWRFAGDDGELGLEVVLRVLVEQFALLAVVPHGNGSAPARRVLKLSWIDGMTQREGLVPWFLTRMAWSPVELRLPTSQLAWTRSFHIQMEAPSDDVEVAWAALSVAGRWAAVEEGSPAHLRFALGDPPPSDGTRSDAGADDLRPSTTFALRPTGGGFLRLAFFSCLLSTVLLVLGRWRLDDLHANVEATVTLLIFVPGLLSLFAVRQGEHAVATHLFSGVRCMVITAAVCVLAAAVLLILDVDPVLREALWSGLTGISTIATLLVTWSTFGVDPPCPEEREPSTARHAPREAKSDKIDWRPTIAFGAYGVVLLGCMCAGLLAHRDRLGVERRFERAIEQATPSAAGDVGRLPLATFAEIPWTRMYVFGPGAKQTDMARALRSHRIVDEGDLGARPLADVARDPAVLVLVDRNTISVVFTLERATADLSRAAYPRVCHLAPVDTLEVERSQSGPSAATVSVREPETC